MTTGIIYKWTNLKDGKGYVGQTIDPEGRYYSHIHGAFDEKYKNTRSIFERALHKYGLKNFKYEVVEDNIPEEMLNDKETYYVELFDTFFDHGKGYNMTTGGGQTIFSEESKKKMSESQSGKPKSEEARKKQSKSMSGENNPNYGKHQSEETRNKNSESHKGKYPSEESKKKNSESHKGKETWNKNGHMSEESKKKNSESHKHPLKRAIFQTPTGEMIEMSINPAHRFHPDWVLIQERA